eukprot:TRINITY_DN5432_c0_g1_i8.p1 TRINITY_DN5432_c0_g1~~TRINITY_DN5432_c0_g1_i8.p1  ORF type:complete len:260 (-),score=40.32 TRINITY_DN5432_c0_g1_i8:129-908(-)
MSSVPGSWRMQMLPAASQKVPAVLLLPGVPTIVPPAPALPPRVLPAEFSVPPPPARDAPQINRAGPCLDLADAFQPSALESPGCAPKLREDNLKSSNADGSLTTQAKEEARCHWRESKRPRARWADMMCSSDDEDTHTSFSWSVGSGSSSDTTAPGSTITQGANAFGTPESQRTASFEQVDDGCFGSDQEDVDHWQEEVSGFQTRNDFEYIDDHYAGVSSCPILSTLPARPPVAHPMSWAYQGAPSRGPSSVSMHHHLL